MSTVDKINQNLKVLPESAQIEVLDFVEFLKARLVESGDSRKERAQTEILDVLSRRYNTGQTDAAARHNEHQP